MRVLGSAKTKLILFGEHAAVYGYPAVGLPLPWKLEISLTPSAKMKWNLEGLCERHQPKLGKLLQVLPEIFPELLIAPPLEISAFSDAPIGVGLGSSSALTTALTRAIFSLLGKEENTCEAVWRQAHALEKIFHRTPSGIDTGIAAYETLSAFERKEEELPYHTTLKTVSLPLVIGALPRDSDTATLVSELRVRKEKDRTIADKIESLGNISASAIDQFKTQHPSLSEIGQLAGNAQSILQSLSLSTKDLDKLIEFGMNMGALGGKLSGAGGGGAYYFVTESCDSAKELADALNCFSKEHCIHHPLPPTAITFTSH